MAAWRFLIYLWPHILVMVGIVLLIWRGENRASWPFLGAAIAGSAVGLTVLYRFLPEGPAPTSAERISVGGWIAVVLTVTYPLVAVAVAAAITRTLALGMGMRVAIVVATGFMCLGLLPIVSVLVYGAFTGVHL